MNMWQPIETAPKDGSFILLATPKGRIADGFWALTYGVWSWPYVMIEPTHWMPLPELPGARSQPAPSVQDGWLRAIDEALVVAHIGVANESDTYEQAKAKLDTLIGLHVDIATDPAVNGGWKLVPVEILDRFPEINQNNYNHDDVCNLNAWGVELVLAAAPEAKP